MADTPTLPEHIDETVRTIARLHAEHYQQAPRLQRTMDRITAFGARPGFAGLLTIGILCWVLVNLAALWSGSQPFDRPPFPWLQGGISLLALYLTALILTTTWRENELEGYRAQLTLELAIVSEQKSTKIIQLLEELRRDSPLLADRVDHHANAMSQPANPQAVLEAIKESRQEMASPDMAGR